VKFGVSAVRLEPPLELLELLLAPPLELLLLELLLKA
jgi:hypothetical protein